jgi:hypothetical protein
MRPIFFACLLAGGWQGQVILITAYHSSHPAIIGGRVLCGHCKPLRERNLIEAIVLRFLSRYTSWIAISNWRLFAFYRAGVTFRHKIFVAMTPAGSRS